MQRVGDEYVAKIADFGLSALVRIGEDGYHTSKSSKRKSFDSLHEVFDLCRVMCEPFTYASFFIAVGYR